MKGKRSQNRETNLAEKYPTSGQCTTVMIRNIPNEYTQDELIQEVTETMESQDLFDFFYLPWDLQNGGNAGYAFVNFHDNVIAQKAVRVFSSYKFRKHDSRKTGKVAPAHIQGLENNLRHLRDRAVVHGNHPCSPVVMWRGEKVELSAVFQELRAQDALQKFVGTTGPNGSSPGGGGGGSLQGSRPQAPNNIKYPPSSAPGGPTGLNPAQPPAQVPLSTGLPQPQRSSGGDIFAGVEALASDLGQQAPSMGRLDLFEDDASSIGSAAVEGARMQLIDPPRSAPHLKAYARQRLQDELARGQLKVPPGSAPFGAGGTDTLSARFGIVGPPRTAPMSMDGLGHNIPIVESDVSAQSSEKGIEGLYDDATSIPLPSRKQLWLGDDGVPDKFNYALPPQSDPGMRPMGAPPGLSGTVNGPPLPLRPTVAASTPGEALTKPGASDEAALSATRLANRMEAAAAADAGPAAPMSSLLPQAGPLAAMAGLSSVGSGSGPVEIPPPGASEIMEIAVGNADEDVMKKFLSKFSS